MTIADAFNEITIAQGGTPNYSGTIASAIDALNDALAGSDQPAETTIEGAVRLLGQHIGGGGGGGSEYDAEILITVPESSADPTTIEALKGSYDELMEKHGNGGFVRVCVLADNKAASSNVVYPSVLTDFGGENEIIVSFHDFGAGANVDLLWASDNTIAFAD